MPARWLVSLIIAVLVAAGASRAEAQVFKPRGKGGAKAPAKKATPAPAGNQARGTAAPTPRRVVTAKQPAKKGPVAERPAAPKKAPKGKKSNEEVVIDDDEDDDEVTITDD